ncbi:hypothetical protein GGH18_003973 [Coemansia sp. RSA 530]|nr:hypothetical protein GGH18_003973 [Coemansia sp. RSA 530]
MKIQNLRRSNPQSESIPVAFDFDTPTNKIYALHDRMNAFAEENSRDFVVPVGFNVDLLENSNRIQISVGINYKSNWQDGGKRYDAKTRFAFALRQAITDLGLRYAMPLQPVAMVAPPPGYDDAPNVECERPNEVHSDDDDIFGPQSGNMSRGEFRNVQQGPHGTHNGTGDSGNNSGVPTSAVAGVMLANEL